MRVLLLFDSKGGGAEERGVLLVTLTFLARVNLCYVHCWLGYGTGNIVVGEFSTQLVSKLGTCLLYTSDAADE